jgi:hypothetical protein
MRSFQTHVLRSPAWHSPEHRIVGPSSILPLGFKVLDRRALRLTKAPSGCLGASLSALAKGHPLGAVVRALGPPSPP